MRKKTQDEKALSGTTRLDRTGELRAKVVTVKEIPKPQKYLTRIGSDVYREICEHLLKHNGLCKIDSLYISQIAHSYSIYRKMAEHIKEKEKRHFGSGYFKTHKSGATQISDEYVVMNREKEAFEKGCRALGLNLASRDKIIAYAKQNEGADEKDPFAEMMKNKEAKRRKMKTA